MIITSTAAKGGKVIIPAFAVGRAQSVLYYFKSLMTGPRNTILFTGFQAGGSRGDRMLKGDKQMKIHGAMYPVRARVEMLTNTSAHADYEEILAWVGYLPKMPKQEFIPHGEAESAMSLKEQIAAQFDWQIVIPDYLQWRTTNSCYMCGGSVLILIKRP